MTKRELRRRVDLEIESQEETKMSLSVISEDEGRDKLVPRPEIRSEGRSREHSDNFLASPAPTQRTYAMFRIILLVRRMSECMLKTHNTTTVAT